MSFQQGLSGLNAASRSLEVIGNNVANANTVGFKQSTTVFADVFANSLTGAGASQIGIGVKVAAVAQEYTQGNVTSSNNPLDIAINGGGFFRLTDKGAISYSRNGQFQLDKFGYIVNANGNNLTGYTADASGVLSTGAPDKLLINTTALPPKQSSEVGAVMNLDSRQPDLVSANFLMSDPRTFTHASAVQIYDSLGNNHTLQTYYVKTAASTWDVFAASDQTLIGTGPVGTVTFDSKGALVTGSLITIPVNVTTGATTPFNVSFNMAGTTQFGNEFGVTTLNQDGYSSGQLAGFSAAADGIIIGRYTNGKSSTLGQIVLASFTNPNGLQSLGNNAWAETATSGQALVGTPKSGALGVLQSNANEESNVDLTAELVDMITAQRYYQANAQTIKTQDQVLQTLVNLR